MVFRTFPWLVLSLLLGFNVAAKDRIVEGEARLAEVLVEFLETGNATDLVKQVAHSVADYEAEARRFGRELDGKERAAAEKAESGSTKNLGGAAEGFLKIAKRYGIFSANAEWRVKSMVAHDLGKTVIDGLHRDFKETMEKAETIRVTLERVEAMPARAELNGEYVIDFEEAQHFPTGWRAYNGICWMRFPKGVVDAVLDEGLEVAAKLPRFGGELTAGDDPALQRLGEKLTRFMEAKDSGYYTENLLPTVSLIYEAWRMRAPDGELPPREELEKGLKEYNGKLLESAQAVLAEADRVGLDLSKVTFVDVSAAGVNVGTRSGTVDEISANEVQITFNIPEHIGTHGRTNAAGEYVLASKGAQRMLGNWYLEDIRWASMPKGLLSNEEVARQEFENFVAKFRALPPGTAAPDIFFTRIADGEGKDTARLSEFKGKIVVIEWWATWCGPCQEPMAELQTIRERYPHWGEDVVVLTLSIDDDLETPRKHLAKKGWNKHPNFWAGAGWYSESAKAFRVSSVPTVYVLGRDGRVANPPQRNWETTVEELLKQEQGKQ